MNDSPSRPTIDLLLAPAAGGKTGALLRQLAAPRRGRALLLVPNEAQRRSALVRLRRDHGRARALTFAGLADLLLRRAQARPAILAGLARTALVRLLLADEQRAGRLPTYGAVAEKPGFVAAVAALLDDLGSATIEPATLAGRAETPHDHEIAAIYQHYVDFQRERDVADLPRRLGLATEALARRPGLLNDTAIVAVDGFDQFSPRQLDLLAALAAGPARVVVTLTGAAGDRPAHRRFSRTLRQLRDRFATNETSLPAAPERRAPPLAFIEERLFELDAAGTTQAGAAVALIEAADREREARAVLRRVAGLRRAGVPDDAIAILYRDGMPYRRLLREIAAEYGLPLDVDGGLPLAESPPIAALLALIAAPAEDYQRRTLLEALRSPYLGPAAPVDGGALAEGLDAVARGAGVAGGLARWRRAFALLANATPDEDEQPAIAPEDAATLGAAFERLVAWLTQPERADMAAYVAWVRERRGALSCEGSPFTERDEAALQSFDDLLRELEAAAALLDPPPTTFDGFLAQLRAAAGATHYDRAPHGGVAALQVLAARGRTFDHVFLLGLSEGEFPQPLPEPPIYGRAARRRLALPAPDPADERTLFYEAVTRARRTLTLSRTRLDEAGTPLPRSPYLKELLALLPDVRPTRIAAGSVPDAGDACSAEESALALAEDLARPAGDSAGESFVARHADLAARYPAWPHAVRGRQVEAWRFGVGGYGRYEGALSGTPAVAALAEAFGSRHEWSITQINDYLTCPFRFAAAHVLRLAPRSDPQDDLDPARRGQIYHAILARAAERWRARGLAPETTSAEQAQAELDAAADDVLANAPERYGFEPSGFWPWEQDEIRRRLRAALRGFLDGEPAHAEAIEQRFGGTSRNPPLRLATSDGPVLIQGRIDRVDALANGSLAVIDYKSSATPRPAAESLAGDDVQLAIYALAAAESLPIGQGRSVERAAFWHIGSGRRAELEGNHLRQAIDAARERVAGAVAAAQAGDLRVRPTRQCPAYCAYEPICRRNLAKRAATEQAQTPDDGPR